MIRANGGVQVKQGKLESLVLSPSGIRRFESCPAGYLFSNMRDMIPKMDTTTAKTIVSVGKQLHNLSEYDFDEEFADTLLYFEKESKQKEVKQLAGTAANREYLKLPSVTEVFMTSQVKNAGRIRGFPDRIARDNDKFYIIDLKTTGNPDPYGDRKQTLSYVYMLVSISNSISKYIGDRNVEDIDKAQAIKELSKKLYIDKQHIEKLIEITNWEKVSYNQVTMILDYVRVDSIHSFDIRDHELEAYENYLISTFMKVKKVINSWLTSKDINMVEHHPGNCGLCPMIGICKAYNIVVNPHYDPINPQEIETEDIIKELIDRDYAKKINEERGKALKRALVMRDQGGDSKVREHCSVVTVSNTMYPTNAVLSDIIPKLMKEPVKNVQFKDMVDWEYIYKTTAALIRKMTSENMKSSNIPGQYIDDLENVKIVYSNKPYIRLKS